MKLMKLKKKEKSYAVFYFAEKDFFLNIFEVFTSRKKENGPLFTTAVSFAVIADCSAVLRVKSSYHLHNAGLLTDQYARGAHHAGGVFERRCDAGDRAKRGHGRAALSPRQCQGSHEVDLRHAGQGHEQGQGARETGRCNSWHRRIDMAPYVCLVAGTPVTHPDRSVRSTFWSAPPARSFSSWT
jgi:hypothetical protein